MNNKCEMKNSTYFIRVIHVLIRVKQNLMTEKKSMLEALKSANNFSVYLIQTMNL